VADPYFDIAMAAADIRERVPQEFARLLEAFKRLDEHATVHLRAASPDQILAVQATSRVTEKLVEKFENCMTIKRQAETKRG